jgi:nicotinamidase-related amidase
MTQTRFFDFGLTFVRPVLLARDRSSALLIIDMQYHDASPDQGFNLAVEQIQPGAMKYFNERNERVVIPTIRELLEYFREQSLPVIYLTLGSDYADYRDIPPRMREWIRDVEERSGVQNIFWTGNPAFAIRREIKPLPGETTICKRTFGAFNSSNLDQFLRDTGVRNLVITGISTNACVETTARDAADRGWGCVLVSRGMADYDAEAHEASLRAFHFNFGRVVDSAADVITAMEQGAPL